MKEGHVGVGGVGCKRVVNIKLGRDLLGITYRLIFFVSEHKLKKRNDPSAGSPTDALLRLFFPLDLTVRVSFHSSKTTSVFRASPLYSQRSPSVRATGGVYKGQGRIPGGLLNQRPVQGIPS